LPLVYSEVMSKPDPKRASTRERAHFEAIARAMVEEKQAQIEAAARDETAEGIVIGLEMSRFRSFSPEIQAMEDARAYAQIELYHRWRRLCENRK
jgi:hypothetical protein